MICICTASRLYRRCLEILKTSHSVSVLSSVLHQSFFVLPTHLQECNLYNVHVSDFPQHSQHNWDLLFTQLCFLQPELGHQGFLYEAQMPPSELYPALFYVLLKWEGCLIHFWTLVQIRLEPPLGVISVSWNTALPNKFKIVEEWTQIHPTHLAFTLPRETCFNRCCPTWVWVAFRPNRYPSGFDWQQVVHLFIRTKQNRFLSILAGLHIFLAQVYSDIT